MTSPRSGTATPRIALDPQLVERYVMELGAFGETGETGVSRPVYGPAWVAAADQYAAWCGDAGLEVGSHLDSQTPGGRYDGALGALSGLIALRALRARYGPPRRTLEAVALCEEEGSRFPSASWWGSRAITGRIEPGDWDRVTGYEDENIGDAMRQIGLDPERSGEARRDDIAAFIELHIEQGPILEQADLPVAIVSAITGIRHYGAKLSGTQNHAGAFPMDMRRDPMAGFAEIASGVINTAHRLGRPAVTTVGRIGVEPNFPAIVPASVSFTIDARHPDPAARERLYAMHEGLAREVALRRDLDLSLWKMIDHPPCICDPALVDTLKAAAADQDVPTMVMASGAGHDSQQMASIAPVAMLFVRSKDGRSHTPDEFSSVADIVAGIEVLAAALHRLAY
jgi:allantoate deiminase